MRAVAVGIGRVVLLALAVSTAGAQGLVLQLRPRVGDTLYMRLDQTSRLITARLGAGGARDALSILRSEMHVFSHAVVESRSDDATTVLAVTDSVVLISGDHRPSAADVATARKLKGQRTHIRVALDGGVTILASTAGGNAAPRGMAEAASLIPATFPRSPVAVDDSWRREMLVPAGTTALGTTVGGRVQALFRLDSTTHGGRIAHVSIRGELHPDDARIRGGAMLESGSVAGTLVVDRARGWLAESNVTVVAHSIMLPLAGLTGTGITLEMTVTQRMRLLDRP